MVVNELQGEKIDIVPFSDDNREFVMKALSPAKVKEVNIDPETGTAEVIVPDYQLSLAIGKEGQNARLAARLTGWRIDIRSETQVAEDAAYEDQDWAEGEWITDPETGEQKWQPADGSPAISAEDWSAAVAENDASDDEAAAEADGAEAAAPAEPATDAEPAPETDAPTEPEAAVETEAASEAPAAADPASETEAGSEESADAEAAPETEAAAEASADAEPATESEAADQQGQAEATSRRALDEPAGHGDLRCDRFHDAAVRTSCSRRHRGRIERKPPVADVVRVARKG